MLVAGQLAAAATGDQVWAELALPAWYVAWGAWVVWMCRRNGLVIRRLIGRPPRSRGEWAYVGMAVPLLCLSVGLLWLQMGLASWVAPERVRDWLAEQAAAPADSAVLVIVPGLLVTVVLAPVVEELVFRGVLLRSWSRSKGFSTAVLSTAALFALLHPFDLLGSFAFGVVLATIRLRTRSILVPIACHALYNALALLLGYGDAPAPGGTESISEMMAELRRMWWVGAACVAAGGGVVTVFLRRQLTRP